MKITSQKTLNGIGVLAISAIIGSVIAFYSPGNFLDGFWRSSLFSSILLLLFLLAVKHIQVGRFIVVISTAAFLIRLLVGIGLYVALPLHGFDTEVQNAGYSYSDAYLRDQGAYLRAFPEKSDLEVKDLYNADQYGGLSLISVMVYRLFSADVHRPLLMVLFSAFSFSIAVLFLWRALQIKWGDKVSKAAIILLAAYPEGIILGSSQMREPALIALAAISFLAVILFNQGKRQMSIYLLFALAILMACWISIPAGLVILMVEVGFLLVFWINEETNVKNHWVKIGLFFVFISISIFAGWSWLKDTLYYDAYLTETESGMVAALLEKIGISWRVPFVMLYGLIQPVLPAALIYQSLPIWKSIAIFRAVGWYFIIPLLLYGVGVIWNDAHKRKNWGLFWLTLMDLIWIVVSSARAGGDQWDNPRYRAIFLPWMSLIVAWVWVYLRSHRSTWFWRIVLIEGVFVILFTNWYLNRVLGAGLPIPVNWLLLIFVLFAMVTVLFGFIWDRLHNKQVISSNH